MYGTIYTFIYTIQSTFAGTVEHHLNIPGFQMFPFWVDVDLSWNNKHLLQGLNKASGRLDDNDDHGRSVA